MLIVALKVYINTYKKIEILTNKISSFSLRYFYHVDKLTVYKSLINDITL